MQIALRLTLIPIMLVILVLPLTAASQEQGLESGGADPGSRSAEAEGEGGNAQGMDGIELPEITVADEREGDEDSTGYISDDSTTATKTDAPILLTPFSVEVVDEQLIDDQYATRLKEALRNVSGVATGGAYSAEDYYRIRGFDASFNTFLDGLPIDREFWFEEEVFGLERIEVLKGPSSAIYGFSPVGGLVNLISKRPVHYRFADLHMGLGNYEFGEFGADIGGALDSGNALLGRLNLLYRRTGSFVDFIGPADKFFAAPSLTVNIGPNTSITFLTQVLHNEGDFAMPLVAPGTVLPNPNGKLPISRNIGEPNWSNRISTSRVLLGYEFVHAFDEVFSAHSRFRYGWNKASFRGIYPEALEEDLRTLLRAPYRFWEDYWTLSADNFAEAKFDTGPVAHTVLAGVDYFYVHHDFTGQFSTIGPLDLYDPVYGAEPGAFSTYTKYYANQNQLGLYVQEQAVLCDRFSLLAGGRIDFVWAKHNDVFLDTKQDSSDNKFSPRAGVAYEFYPGISVYGNFAQSFFPQSDYVDVNGKALPPETGTEWEAGVKTLLFEGRVQSTVALYHLTKENVAVADQQVPGVYINTGKQRSQGVEVDLAVNVLPGWDFTGAYAYTDSEVIKDTFIPKGTPALNVPKNALSLWTKYMIRTGILTGLGAGFGGQYYSKQSGDFLHTFDLPSYYLLQAAAYYTRGWFRAQINIENLTDERYFPGSYSYVYVNVGQPFTVRGEIGVTF